MTKMTTKMKSRERREGTISRVDINKHARRAPDRPVMLGAMALRNGNTHFAAVHSQEICNVTHEFVSTLFNERRFTHTRQPKKRPRTRVWKLKMYVLENTNPPRKALNFIRSQKRGNKTTQSKIEQCNHIPHQQSLPTDFFPTKKSFFFAYSML